MKLEWHIEDNDIQAIKNIIESRKHRKILLDRQIKNVDGEAPAITKNDLWFTQILCLLTTQQRSGPNRPVSNFLFLEPFPLSLTECQQVPNVQNYVLKTLSNVNGIRFAPKIAKQASENYQKLEDGEWQILMEWAEKLHLQRSQIPNQSHYWLESSAVTYVDLSFEGFGPKQSRNFWQYLGLSRYQFVLDTRIVGWIQRNLNFPIPLSASCLSDEGYYLFISDSLQLLCQQAEVLPCIFDAAVFDSYDTEEW